MLKKLAEIAIASVVWTTVGFNSLGPGVVLLAQDSPYAQPKSDFAVPKSGGTVVAGGSGAPDDADYLVGTANGDLSAEIAVGTSPGGELGGTWGTPTLDDTVSVASWSLTTSTGIGGFSLTNAATSAGFLDLYEDTDNGTNRVRLIGPASTADVTVTLPAATTTLVGTDTTDTLSSKTLTTPIVANGATSAGYIEFREDTDNGANYVRILGIDTIGSDRTLQLPSIAGAMTLASTNANSWDDDVTQTFNPAATNSGINIGSHTADPSSADNGDLWYNTTDREPKVRTDGANTAIGAGGPDYIAIYDEFACGTGATGATIIGSCIGGAALATGGTAGVGGPETPGGSVDYDRMGLMSMSVDASDDQVSYQATNASIMNLSNDRTRLRFAVRFEDLADTDDDFKFWGGMIDVSGSTADQVPTDGAWFQHFATAPLTEPNWMIAVGDGATTTADCGVAVVVDTWYDLEIYYEAATGVHFYVNGAECSNSPINDANLPVAAGDMFRPYQFKMEKGPLAVGASAKVAYIDYFKFTVPVTR